MRTNNYSSCCHWCGWSIPVHRSEVKTHLSSTDPEGHFDGMPMTHNNLNGGLKATGTRCVCCSSSRKLKSSCFHPLRLRIYPFVSTIDNIACDYGPFFTILKDIHPTSVTHRFTQVSETALLPRGLWGMGRGSDLFGFSPP